MKHYAKGMSLPLWELGVVAGLVRLLRELGQTGLVTSVKMGFLDSGQ